MLDENDIYGCALGCPLQRRLMDCPYNEFDHLSFKEKVIHLQNINKEKRELIIEHHLSCTRNRRWDKI